MDKEIFVYVATVLLVFSFIYSVSITYTREMHMQTHNMDMSMDEKREAFISLRSDIQSDLMPHGDYRCCLEKPCTYCIEKTPGHGEGAICNCLEDVVTGVHPCGECIGEIMEGHGNKYLAPYFAKAIAEKMGEHHLHALKQMMSEKYEISIEDQL